MFKAHALAFETVHDGGLRLFGEKAETRNVQIT